MESSSVDLLTPYDFSSVNLGWWNGTNWTFTFHFPDDEVWFHGGYMPGVRARMNYYPEDSAGVIILTNGEGQYGWVEEELAANIVDFATSSPTELPCVISDIDREEKGNVKIRSSLSSGSFKIENIDIKNLRIYDISGQEISYQSSSDFETVNLKGKGLFLLEIESSAGQIYVEKLVVY